MISQFYHIMFFQLLKLWFYNDTESKFEKEEKFIVNKHNFQEEK